MPKYTLKVGVSSVGLEAALGNLCNQLGVTDCEVEVLQIRLAVDASGLIATYFVQGQQCSSPKYTID